jgi:hypothetical protein
MRSRHSSLAVSRLPNPSIKPNQQSHRASHIIFRSSSSSSSNSNSNNSPRKAGAIKDILKETLAIKYLTAVTSLLSARPGPRSISRQHRPDLLLRRV